MRGTNSNGHQRAAIAPPRAAAAGRGLRSAARVDVVVRSDRTPRGDAGARVLVLDLVNQHDGTAVLYMSVLVARGCVGAGAALIRLPIGTAYGSVQV